MYCDECKSNRTKIMVFNVENIGEVTFIVLMHKKSCSENMLNKRIEPIRT